MTRDRSPLPEPVHGFSHVAPTGGVHKMAICFLPPRPRPFSISTCLISRDSPRMTSLLLNSKSTRVQSSHGNVAAHFQSKPTVKGNGSRAPGGRNLGDHSRILLTTVHSGSRLFMSFPNAKCSHPLKVPKSLTRLQHPFKVHSLT